MLSSFLDSWYITELVWHNQITAFASATISKDLSVFVKWHDLVDDYSPIISCKKGIVVDRMSLYWSIYKSLPEFHLQIGSEFYQIDLI